VLDRKWREHLYEMDYLREGIGLRAMAQRDPLIEYQREGYDMFSSMMEGIKEESVGTLFNARVEVQEEPSVAEAPPDEQALPGGQAQPVPPPAETVPAAAQQRPRGRHAQTAKARARQSGAGQRRRGGQDGQPREAVPAGLARGAAAAQPRRQGQLEYSAPTMDGGLGVERHTESAAGGDFTRVGRNDLCPCGSGRKFKRCHGDPRNRGGA
jgi:preprotein translocase subunit SecA